MSEPEVWLRGPVPSLTPLLQPVAHGLLQCRVEVRGTIPTLSAEQIWTRPHGVASVGYHARHAVGSLDRLLTYARAEQLSASQLGVLAHEDRSDLDGGIGATLVAEFDAAVERAIAQLKATPVDTLLEAREVGRGRLPSTVLGLLFHAAEHTQRHVGQLVTTAKVVLGEQRTRT